MAEDLSASIAAALLAARTARGMTTSALAERSGVSRAMITKVERAEAQPTAALLGRLCGPLGLTLSQLVARAEASVDGRDRRLVRAGEQVVWVDPGTGYRRRSVSPPAGGPLELVEVELPAGASVTYPGASYAGVHQQVWVLAGRLRLTEGDGADAQVHELAERDCLQLGPPAACTFTNPGARACRYLVALAHRPH